MKRYDGQQKLIQITCNLCGKTADVLNDILNEAFFSADLSWGYFSNKDGRRDRWDLCESCYDQMTSAFKIQMETSEKTVLMDE